MIPNMDWGREGSFPRSGSNLSSEGWVGRSQGQCAQGGPKATEGAACEEAQESENGALGYRQSVFRLGYWVQSNGCGGVELKAG